MSQVTLQIGGRSYNLACAEGEEAHIMRLGREIDEKVTAITGGKPAPEGQSLLFAALTLADELHELRATPAEDPEVAGALESLADALENCASKLEARASAA